MIKENYEWTLKIKGYNPDQPRVSAGNPRGGQWASDLSVIMPDIPSEAFWRIQSRGHSIFGHTSSYWGGIEPEQLEGVAASTDEHELMSLIQHWYSATPEVINEHEVVIFEGIPIRDIGDGWVVDPTNEIYRMPARDFVKIYMPNSHLNRQLD